MWGFDLLVPVVIREARTSCQLSMGTLLGNVTAPSCNSSGVSTWCQQPWREPPVPVMASGGSDPTGASTCYRFNCDDWLTSLQLL